MKSELAFALTAVLVILIVSVLIFGCVFCYKSRSPRWYIGCCTVRNRFWKEPGHEDIEKSQAYHHQDLSETTMRQTARFNGRAQYSEGPGNRSRGMRDTLRADVESPHQRRGRRATSFDSVDRAPLAAARKAIIRNPHHTSFNFNQSPSDPRPPPARQGRGMTQRTFRSPEGRYAGSKPRPPYPQRAVSLSPPRSDVGDYDMGVRLPARYAEQRGRRGDAGSDSDETYYDPRVESMGY